MAKEFYIIGVLFPTETGTEIKYVTEIKNHPKVALWKKGKEAQTFF